MEMATSKTVSQVDIFSWQWSQWGEISPRLIVGNGQLKRILESIITTGAISTKSCRKVDAQRQFYREADIRHLWHSEAVKVSNFPVELLGLLIGSYTRYTLF